MNLGNAVRSTDVAEARQCFERGIEIGTGLLDEHPDWNALLADMGRLAYSLGRLEADAGHVRESADRFGEALGHYERLLARSPQLAGLRGEVVRLTGVRADLLEDLGDFEAAVVALERIRELSDGDARAAAGRRIEGLQRKIRER